MTPDLISLAQVRATAHELLKTLDDPDHRNPKAEGGCLYTYEDGSHCIAGEVLDRLGVPIPGFGERDNQWSLDNPDHLHYVRARLTPAALGWLVDVQRRADQFTAWRECVAYADARTS